MVEVFLSNLFQQRSKKSQLLMYFLLQEDLVEKVVQDPVYKCEEKQEENCHITFVTTFKSHSEEDCAEHFEKKCQIRKGLNLNFLLLTKK